MSVARLLLSGLLVASGLILGAFTLHGAFAPQLPLLMQATGPRGPVGEAWVTTTRAAAGSAVVQKADTPRLQPASQQDAKPASTAAADAKAAEEKARRRQAAKRRAEKRLTEAQKVEKAKQQPQQATFQWPWNWN
jgi:hypothetical protein